ncbi:MAG: hypothetical protein ABSC30_16840 [Acidimicrobiales bacterium]
MARTPGGRARTTRIAMWFTLALVALFGAEIGLATSQSPRVRAPGPIQLLNETFRAAGRSDAFHYRAVWRADGVLQVVVGDARPSSGSESVAVGNDRFSVVYTGQEAYFEGVAAALRDQLGLPATTASADAGKWISLQQSDGPFPSVEEGVTTSAALGQVLIAPSAISPAHRTHGVLLTRITGRIPHGRVVTGSARLDLLTRSKLPAAYSAHGSGGGQSWSSTITFSRWGANNAIEAPAGALPFSSLQRSTPVPTRTPTSLST